MAYTTIDDPSAYFQTVLWSGSGSGQAITNGGNSDLQPDFVWLKKRAGGSARAHGLYDSSRGVTKLLHSNSTGAESTQGAGLTAFGSDGFTVGDDDGNDGSGGTYVAWQWKANGGTTSSNSNGSITTTVQANTSAGFSIVLYTSASGAQTIGHGLGVKPDMYIIKERTTSGDDWFVYHSAIGAGKKLRLSDTNGEASDTNIWQNTEPNNQVAYLQNDGGGVNQNTGGNQNYVGYFFTSIQGYSKFGGYTGNGATDGTFVYTGFRPAFVLTKKTYNTSNWHLSDSKRTTHNPVVAALTPDQNYVENTTLDQVGIDFLSNGFKFRGANDTQNGAGTYVYAAFAEHPFVSSEGIPCTAR